MNSITQISPVALKRELDQSADLFILDLRNEDEFADWRIEGKQPVETLNIPYFIFLEDEEGSSAKVPRGREITLVCAKGGASEYIGELLIEKGFRARNLEGGLLAWSDLYVPRTVKTEAKDGILLIQVARIAKGCLSYMVGSQGEALVVDAGRNSELYAEVAREHGLTIKGVIDTHLHADHISGGRHLAKLVTAPYYLPPADATQVPFPFEPLTNGQKLTIGDARIQSLALLSPGHTQGSTSILVNDRFLLTGDTLFVYSVGRPDLGGQAVALVQELYDTLFTRYAGLADEVEIYPTHFSGQTEFNEDGVCMTTLGESRQTNAAMQIKDRAAFARHILEDMPPHPANFDRIRQTNMGLVSLTEDEANEAELGPNRCAASK